MRLVYTGGGWMPSIPARDLTEDEVEKYGKQILLDSGLYAKPEKKSIKKDSLRKEGE